MFGDSDSAAYGVDGSSCAEMRCLEAAFGDENFVHGWIRGVQQLVGGATSGMAEAHVQAVSGIGVTRSAGGGKEKMPQLLRRSLQA